MAGTVGRVWPPNATDLSLTATANSPRPEVAGFSRDTWQTKVNEPLPELCVSGALCGDKPVDNSGTNSFNCGRLRGLLDSDLRIDAFSNVGEYWSGVLTGILVGLWRLDLMLCIQVFGVG